MIHLKEIFWAEQNRLPKWFKKGLRKQERETGGRLIWSFNGGYGMEPEWGYHGAKCGSAGIICYQFIHMWAERWGLKIYRQPNIKSRAPLFA